MRVFWRVLSFALDLLTGTLSLLPGALSVRIEQEARAAEARIARLFQLAP